MTRAMSNVERAAFLALAGCLGLIQLSIAGAEILLDVAGILWLVVVITERRRLAVPTFFWPLVGLALWTLVSSAFSMDPFESFKRDRQLLLYLIVPMTMTLARGPRASTTANVIIALGAAGALVGIVQYAALGYDNLNQRPHGLLGHYMTYSGVLMLVICTATAQLLFRDRDWVWPAVAVPALLVALVATFSRNAWIGAVLAILTLAMFRRAWKLVAVVPVVVVLFVLVAPAGIRQRALSSFDPNDATNRDRIAMLKSGKAMIADHPWTLLIESQQEDAARAVHEQLGAAGWLCIQRRRMLGVIRTDRLDVYDEDMVSGLAARVTDALRNAIDDRSADPRPLAVGLLGVLGQMPAVFSFTEAAQRRLELHALTTAAIEPLDGLRQVIETHYEDLRRGVGCTGAGCTGG